MVNRCRGRKSDTCGVSITSAVPLPIRALISALLPLMLQAIVLGQSHGASLGGPDFSSVIRPILSNHCFQCHGPDQETREAELRLDRMDLLKASDETSSIVIPGNAAGSQLIQRILSPDDDLRMPPAGSGKVLTTKQQLLLVDWVNSGANWQQHWSFVPPERPGIPELSNPGDFAAGFAVDSAIDRFLMERLHAEGLTFSPAADPWTQVRRLFLDLIGLPPTPEEADGWIAGIWGTTVDPERASKFFAADERQYQALVDHLLGRSEYGERWARRWLDLARYADSNGYEKDRPRSIWPYRDWVIDALNADMPFDRFTVEQLAGDLLPNAGRSQLVATGFHRNTMLNEEGGIDPLEFRFHAMTDRVAVTGTVWLGLTIGCAQCHTHKYDPVTHRDYYQLMALMNNADEPALELRPSDYDKRFRLNQKQAAERIRALEDKWPVPAGELSEMDDTQEKREVRRKAALRQAFEQWLDQQRRSTVRWSVLQPVAARSNLPWLQIQDDASIFASGDTTKQDTYEIQFAAHDAAVTAIRLEALPDERLPGRGPGTTYYEGREGDFYLTEFSAFADERPVSFRSATESYARNQFSRNPVSAQLTLDGDVQTGWSVFGGQGERHTAVYVLKQPLPASTTIRVGMQFGRHFASSLGRFRISVTDSLRDDGGEPTAKRMPDSVEQLLLKPDDQLTKAESEALFRQFLLTAAELSEHAEPIRSLLLPPEVPTTLILRERPPENPRPTHRYHRGEYLQPREHVQPAGLPILHEWPEQAPQDRLGLALWLTDRRNPLTARVVVNQQWAAFFGQGIVSSVDDFGFQGSPPSHPALLDWLAVTLMDDDQWSLKRLHRRIVTSVAYRQQSRLRADMQTIDPDNRMLGWSPRYRLDAEIVRDSALRSAGVLSSRMGGPPVYPLQPPGITEVAFGRPGWNTSEGEDRYRRSIYTFIKRTAPFAMVTTFDGPAGDACIPRRTRSNTPLQALTLLNDPMFVDIAAAMGAQMAQAGEAVSSVASPDQDVQAAVQLFRRLLTRYPSSEEVEDLLAFVGEQRQSFQTNSELAISLLGNHWPAKNSVPTETDSDSSRQQAEPSEAAAWAALTRAVLSLDEFQTRP